MSPSFRRRAPLAAVAALGLALPAQAAAATPFLSSTAKGPKGYTLSVSGGAGNAQVSLYKSRKGVAQNHALFTSTKVTYTAKGDLSKATLKAGLGAYGKVSMKFTATAKAKKSLPKGCTGVASKSRKGVLKGVVKYKLKSGGHTYTAVRLPGTLSKSGNLRCGGAGGGKPPHGYGLNVFGSASALSNSSFFASRTKGSTKVSQSVSINTTTPGGVSLSHSIFVTKKGAKYLNPKSDLSSASAKAAGPLKGGFTYTAENPVGGSRSSFGSVAGSIKAAFDFIGTKTIKAGTANLSKF